jgi:hypothetical protein
VVAASLITAIASFAVIVWIPALMVLIWGGIGILTGTSRAGKPLFACLLFGHLALFFLANFVGLLLGSLYLRGKAPAGYFWILAASTLAATIVELATGLGWLMQASMGKTPRVTRRIFSEKAVMLLGTIVAIGVWLLIVPALS